MKTMNEKVTMVTGAAAGIGLVSAEAFAKAGATVVLVDINEPKEQAEKLVSEGYKAVAYRCDVSDTRAVKEMIDWIVATYGRLDAALNNAGIQTPQRPMAEITDEEFDTNTVWGYMIVLKHIVSIARNDGRLPFNPFAGYINSPESVDRGYFTQKEIQTLMDAPMKNTYHELIRDLFIFSVFTGLVYSDVKNLTACKHSSTATCG